MKFFVLETHPIGFRPPAYTDYIAEGDVRVGPDAPKCVRCGKYQGMLPWLPPYIVQLETWGKEFGDVVAGPGPDLLISERLKQIVDRDVITGLTGFDPVKVLRVRKHKRFRASPPPYYCVSVMRSNAIIDQAASKFEWRDSTICPVCRLGTDLKRWSSVIVVSESWEGEGIFLARGLPATVIVSQRFKELCEAEQIKNTVFVAAESYAHDSYPWERESSQQRKNARGK